MATQSPNEGTVRAMRFNGRGAGMKRGLRVWPRTIIGALVVLLMMAVAGCADAEPKSTGVPRVPTSAQVATPTPSVTAPPSPAPVDATDVEVVYASPAYPLPWDQGEYDPLWGDLDTDAPIIDRLLRAIAGGTPVEIVEIDEERTWTPYSSLIMNLRFRNGTTWSVRTAIRCDITSEGRKTKCLPVPDHWDLLHRNEVVVSTALTEWFQRVREYMPSVEHYSLPDQIRLGEPFAISGAGYHEGDRVELSIEFIDQSKLPLGEAPLYHGAFRWDGEFPKTPPTGYAIVSMWVFEGAERVGGLSVSTTVARSTAAGAAAPPPTSAGAEYSAADLARWYERFVDVKKVPGIAWTDLDEARNRIEIGVYPLRGVREEWEAVLATLDVPREAIVINVGCEGISPWPLDPGESPDEAFLRTIDYWLDAVSQAAYGETVQIKLTLQNVSDGPVNLVLGGRPPFDFVVSTADGKQVWHWKCAKITPLALDNKTLEPGEELEFVGEWEQVDNRGEPVPPGVYLVRGVLSLDPPQKLATEAHELQVQMSTTVDSPSSTATPTPVPMPTPERARLERPPHGPGAEIGTTYPYTLYVHCGIRDARFDGRLWMADPMLSDGSGNPPLDWASNDSVGIMELVNDDLAVFTAESGRIIEFRPWPPNIEWRPCFWHSWA